MQKVRSIFLSDIHLGTRACQAGRLLDFLRSYSAHNVFLLGDIVGDDEKAVMNAAAEIVRMLGAEGYTDTEVREDLFGKPRMVCTRLK